MRPRDKIIRYQLHAKRRMQRRGVSEEQVARVLLTPDVIRTARRPGARRFEKKFSRRGRVVVIAEEEVSEFWVITAWRG